MMHARDGAFLALGLPAPAFRHFELDILAISQRIALLGSA